MEPREFNRIGFALCDKYNLPKPICVEGMRYLPKGTRGSLPYAPALLIGAP